MSLPRRFRAPKEDGAILASPPLEASARLIAANSQSFAERPLPFSGRTWDEIRQSARHEVIAAARAYLAAAGEPVPDPVADSAPLLMAGHQPELFHPGVWAKNFALAGLARNHAGIALNLIVDNDTVKTASLRLPVLFDGQRAEAGTRMLDFDRWTEDIPYEERVVEDPDLFGSFPQRVAASTANWGFTPILAEFWRDVVPSLQRSSLLGRSFVSARRSWERKWGCSNLELPVSALCQTNAFAWFFCHLLDGCRRFRELHNHCLRDYRRRYRIRSRSHPVPELATEADWLELPFWAWRINHPRRRRLFGRPQSDRVQLRLEGEPQSIAEISPESDWRTGAPVWERFRAAGVKVRTRALTTTLFARLLLADLFIHGIGGAKYDELTDDIIRGFYGLEPPAFEVLTATLHLPFPHCSVGAAQVRSLVREVRDIHCNPQRHLPPGSDLDTRSRELAAQKQNLIKQEPIDGRSRRERYRTLQRITTELRAYVADRERAASENLAQARRDLQTDAVLHRRDYAFCLFPESKLRSFCTQFLAPAFASDHPPPVAIFDSVERAS